MKWYFVCLIFSFSSVIASDYGVGNGGHVVKCSQYGKMTYELLDFYEMRRNEGIEPEWVYEIENHLHPVFDYVQDGVVNFLDARYTDKDLTYISDHGEVRIDNHCEILQLAYHKYNVDTGLVSFVINQDLFMRLSRIDKAGLWAHEVSYNLLRTLFEDKDSFNARKLTRFLFNKKRMNSQKEGVTLLKEIGFYPVDNFRLSELEIGDIFQRTYKTNDIFMSLRYYEGDAECYFFKYQISRKILSIDISNETLITETTVNLLDENMDTSPKECYKSRVKKFKEKVTCSKTYQYAMDAITNVWRMDSISLGLRMDKPESLYSFDRKIKYSEKEFCLFPFEKIKSDELLIEKIVVD